LTGDRAGLHQRREMKMTIQDRRWSQWLWRALLQGTADAIPGVTAEPPAWLAARAMRCAPPLAVVAALGGRADAATAARGAQIALFCRYMLSRQLQAMRWLQEAGIAVVAMKGLAAALADWPQPAQRIGGDLDLLVRRADLAAIVALFARRGFRFGGVLKSRWGFMSDASYLPFHSPDGVCNIDLHIEPDSYPLHLGLDAAAVFAGARRATSNGLCIAIPAAEHSLLIAVANLAKDKFAPASARKLIDIARLLQGAAALDWAQIERRARRARLILPLRTALSLAVALGVSSRAVPAPWAMPPGGPRGLAWRDLLQRWQAFDDAPAPLPSLLAREWLLSASPAVAARLALRRLRGLVAPRSGVPPPAAGDPALLSTVEE
jgi:hypothetical protein